MKVPQADPMSGTESLQLIYSWASGRCFSTAWMLFLFFLFPQILDGCCSWGLLVWPCGDVFVLRAAWALLGWSCTFVLIVQSLPDDISLPEEPKRCELSGYIHMCMYRDSRLMMSVCNGQSHWERLRASSLPIILLGAACNLIKALLSILLPPQTGFLWCLNIIPR